MGKPMPETAKLLQSGKRINELYHVVYKIEIYDIMKIRL